MDQVTFLTAKNSLLTCKIGNLYLHSAYQPDTEAKRFSDSIKTDFSPSLIFIIEPGLSYCAEYLKQKFPDKKLIAIRLSKAFEKYDSFFDHVIYFSDSFEKDLYETFSESDLLSALFIEWTPASKIFAKELSTLSQALKNLLEKAKASLITQSYFSKRWFSNKIIFNTSLSRTVFLQKGNKPIVICASGPTLLSSTSTLKKYRNSFFLIAASSSLKCLLHNQLIPDLTLSTDGGFWAKNHLLFNLKKYDFPFAITNEAAFPKELFSSKKIIPLIYKDADEKEKEVFTKNNISFLSISRNGTVSGSLLEIAKKLTDNSIYFCGLDLTSGKGKEHADPNRNENRDSLSENRLITRESRLSKRRYASSSLKIYRDWFSNLSIKECEKVFRINPDFCIGNSLGNIKDINLADFSTRILSENKKIASSKDSHTEVKIKEIQERKLSQKEKESIKKLTASFIEYYKNSQISDQELFPSESLFIKKCLDSEEKEKMQKKLSIRKSDFFEKLYRKNYDL